MTSTAWVTYPAQGSQIRAFTARPDGSEPVPAIIIIHGINGCGEHMQDRARDFASHGYLAIAPDIYSNDKGFPSIPEEDILEAAHMGPNPARRDGFLAQRPPERHAAILRARAWIDGRPASGYIDIVRGCFDYLKTRTDVTDIGCLGYCMGGRLTGELAATGVDLAAAVIYYGGHPKLELVPNIKCPVQGHYAVTDHGITDKVPAFAEAMKQAGKEFTYFIYDADHGFSLVPGLLGYDADATRLSLERIYPFLERTLKPAMLVRSEV